ncbi:MAG: hypothetical protein E5X60_38385, partial [Mesorhizobium sp.]
MVEIHWQEIEGNWLSGAALDFHTTSSTPIGHNEAGYMQFDTVRPPIAELLYRLKYKGDQTAAQGIIETAAAFVLPYRAKFDLIIPVPPSTARVVQPVLVLAHGIGEAVNMPVVECITTTRPTAQLSLTSILTTTNLPTFSQW